MPAVSALPANTRPSRAGLTESSRPPTACLRSPGGCLPSASRSCVLVGEVTRMLYATRRSLSSL
jgi:hypothetical protein